jgi:hypothetical protein
MGTVFGPTVADGGAAAAGTLQAGATDGLERVALPRAFRTVAIRDLIAVGPSAGAPGSRFVALADFTPPIRVPHPSDLEPPRGEAWSSIDGLGWQRSHRLPRRAGVVAGLNGSDGAVLALGFDGNRHFHAFAWRLDPDGTVWRLGRLPRLSEEVTLAGTGTDGIVVVDSLWRRGGSEQVSEVFARPTDGDWTRVVLTGVWDQDAVPAAAAATRSGFLVISDDYDGLLAWRSTDGATWEAPRRIPESVDPAFEETREDAPPTLVTDLVYDDRADRLLVLAYPTEPGCRRLVGPWSPWARSRSPSRGPLRAMARTSVSRCPTVSWS